MGLRITDKQTHTKEVFLNAIKDWMINFLDHQGDEISFYDQGFDDIDVAELEMDISEQLEVEIDIYEAAEHFGLNEPDDLTPDQLADYYVNHQ